MLTGLQEEINKWSILDGASKDIIIKTLNEPGTSAIEEWITSPEPVLVTLNTIYTYYISDETLEKLLTALEQTENRVLATRINSATQLDLAADYVITMINKLLVDGICTQEEHDILIRLGQVQKSRAEELFERKITMEDFD